MEMGTNSDPELEDKDSMVGIGITVGVTTELNSIGV